MKHEQTIGGKNLIALAACLLVALAGAAHAQQASSSYRGVQRDPFAKRKFNTKPVKVGPKVIEPPAVEARIAQYKQRKAEAAAAQLPAPKPTSAFLLNEVQVTGIFRTPRGWAAIVEAAPIKLSYTVYPGEHFYNGMLVAIEESRLVFRRESRWTDGRRDTAVEMMPLAKPNAVTDGMTTAANKTDSGNSAASPAAGSMPAALGALLNDEATRKMLEEFSKHLDPNSPQMKSLAEALKSSAANKPK